MPHLPLDLRHLSIWLHPSNRAAILAEDWSKLRGALDRDGDAPTIEISPLCPELYPELVNDVRAKLPKRVERTTVFNLQRIL